MLPNKNWISKAQIRAKVSTLWDSGRLLAELLEPSADLFPYRLLLKAPTSADLSNHFAAAQDWVAQMKTLSSITGLSLEWQIINHRQLGRNELPKALIIASAQDALNWLGKRQEALLFMQLAEQLLTSIPTLRPWVLKKPHQVLAHQQRIPALIRITQWMIEHPKPNRYIRQLSLPEIDTKFIGLHQALLSEWFEQCLPIEVINPQWSPRTHFAARYGFIEKPYLVRFRILDETHAVQGLSDISIPTQAFAQLNLPIKTLFIVENDINALALPNIPSALVLFGRGYGFDFLQQATWLKEKDIWYWGDMDTHGFAILNQCRKILPQTKSFLMDEDTLLTHKVHWTKELKQNKGTLNYLTQEEQTVYHALQTQQFGQCIRLEQEYILYSQVILFLESNFKLEF